MYKQNRGYSSVGRAIGSQSIGLGFESPYLQKLNGFIYMIIFLFILAVMLIFLIRLAVKNNKMIKKIDRQNRLLNTVNQVSSVLLETEPLTNLQSDTDLFDDTIKKSMGYMAEAVGVDRICIWINSNDVYRLCFALYYEWENGVFRSRAKNGILAPNIYFNDHPGWNETLSQGNCINSLARNMSATEQAELAPRNILSLFVVPVFFHDKFWGYVGFDNCRKERLVKESEMLILRSASRMIANTVIRNDMTQNLIDTTRQLEIAKEQAEQSSRTKSTFLSHMSHEIRTPMNAILGIAEIQLQKETLLPEISETFGKIYESGELLLNIINDILDFSKIESGKLELASVKYNLPGLINDTTQLNRLRYESKPIEFSLQLDANIPLELIGDELRIKQVLNNILSNAYKYTDKGKIEFFVSVESGRMKAGEPKNVFLVFRISDTGQGMTEEQLGKLFEEYVRFNLNKNRTIVGSGLGMSITKRLVELMNGEIIVESVPDSGSVFTVRLPQECSGPEICGEIIINKLKNFNFQNNVMLKKMQFVREYMPYGSVLVVDDVESNMYVAKGLLLPYGIKIDAAYNAFDAIEKIKNGNVYDIIFMDHMMPKMDGIEAVKVIRGMGYTQPIVALTANALTGRAKMFLENGFDSFLSKPIDSRELNVTLNEFIKSRKPPEVVEAARRMTPAERAVWQNQILSGEDPRASRIDFFFVRDAENAVNILENCNISDLQTELYITTVHGIKSALANIGEKELSIVAFELESAARQRNLIFLSERTPAFVNALKMLVTKYKSAEDNNDDISGGDSVSEENNVFLHEKLNIIKTAGAAYDKKAAKAAIDELKTKTWPKQINAIINNITVHLLHSDFTDIDELIDKFFSD